MMTVLTDCRRKVVVYTKRMRRLLKHENSRRTKKDHVGSLLGNIGSRNVHSNSQVRLLEGRRIVHTITSTVSRCISILNPRESETERLHSDDMAQCLRALDCNSCQPTVWTLHVQSWANIPISSLC